MTKWAEEGGGDPLEVGTITWCEPEGSPNHTVQTQEWESHPG